MENRGFIAYLFQTMLHEHFHTKAQMANALGVQLRRCNTTLRTLIVRKADLRSLCWKRRCI